MKIMSRIRGTLGSSKILSISNKITFLLLLVFAGVFAFREIYSPDIGFHLGTGRWILNNFQFPDKDVFTYTVGTHEYVNMQWLYQISVTILNNIFGEFGLVAGNAFLIVVCFALVLIRITRKQNLNEISNWQWLFFLAIASAAIIYETRPHTFSWVYLNLVFLVLDEYVDRGINRLKFLPLIMLLWTNTHSLFILGWLVIGSYILGSIWKERKLWTPLTKYGLLSIGISLVNPYFFNGVAYPFQQFQLLQSTNIFKNYIGELLSPLTLGSYFYDGSFVFLNSLLWFHLFLAVSFIVFIIRLKKIQLHELLIFLFFLYLACTAIKNIGFFIFAVLPATIQGLQPRNPAGSVSGKMNWNPLKNQLILNCITIIISLLFIVAIVSDAYYVNLRSNLKFGYKYNNLRLPDKAAQYLLDNHLEGKILNHFNFGGFLIYKLPQKVSIDGRLEVMGQELFLKYLNLWNVIDKSPILSKYQPDIVMFPHESEFLWIHYFKKDTAWRLLYFDEFAAIYVKKGYADKIPSFVYSAQLGKYKKISGSQIDSILKRKYAPASLMSGLTGRYYPLYELGLSTFCYYDDQFEEAVRICLDGLLKCNQEWPELYYNLGHNFFEMKDFRRSLYCYQRYLETKKDRLAYERAALIQTGKAGKIKTE